MHRIILSSALMLAIVALNATAQAQTDDSGTGGASTGSLGQSLNLFGLPMGNLTLASGASGPAITIGSGSSSVSAALPSAITSLFGSSSPTLNLGQAASTAANQTQSLFSTLFGSLPSIGSTSGSSSGGSASGGGTASGLSSLSQSLTSQTLNIAQSFSSSLQNIFAPQTSGGGDGASNQTNTQNNLTSLLPVTALQGSASSSTAATNNGAMFSVSGVTFNFGR